MSPTNQPQPILNRQQRRALARAAAKDARLNGSRPTPLTPFRSRGLLEGDRALLERFDGFAPLRNGLKRVAADRREWAGIPMPIDGQGLVIEPTYPKAKELMKIGRSADAAGAEEHGCTLVNRFWSDRLRGNVLIWREPDGRTRHGVVRQPHHADQLMLTLGAADAWGIEQEGRAVQLLGTLLRHRAFKQYLTTGMFLETSRRSQITYMFRRLRPTLALSMRKNEVRILAALCLHPIAYYDESWAGAMCPTDDVIAHLALMRGDEAMFWRRANQHHPARPEAGI